MEQPIEQKAGVVARGALMAGFLVIFALAGFRLFWPTVAQSLVDKVSVFFEDQDTQKKSSELLTVIFPDEVNGLDPFSLDFPVRERLNNIYEPLIKLDGDLQPYAGLAINWGMVDDLRWSFYLRKGVKFHDGSSFEAADVIATFDLAREKGSALALILESVAEVKEINDYQIEVTTVRPDPLLVQRIAKMLIVPSEWKEGEVVGSGSYKLAKFEPGQFLNLERFSDYWGELPFYKTVKILPIVQKSKRVNTFLTGTVDLLSFVSYDAAEVVEEKGFNLSAVPSLEVQFLLFNFKSEFFAELAARKAVNLAIDRDELIKSVGGYAKPVKQFVSSGVFGFNPKIEGFEYDLKAAKALIKEAELEGVTVQLHLQKGLDVVGEHIRKQLSESGVNVIVSYLDPAAFGASLEQGKADMYFLGFKSDFADAVDLYSALFYTDAEQNFASYDSSEFETIAEQAMVELKPEVRIKYLQEAMRILTEKDIVGVPLFEFENLYGFKKSLNFKPRLDGMIYFNEMS